MKQILINDNSLKIDDIEKEVIRVKALIINSNNKILLAQNNGTYQFPGGHVEGYESLEVCLLREIKEETGIDTSLECGPFMQITTYDDNYFDTGRKVINKIFYYRVPCDELPNLDETNYDELELKSDFNLLYVDLDDLEGFLTKCMDNGDIDVKIGREMLLVMDEYNNIYGG